MLRGVGPEHDDGHDEAGIEEHACGAGEQGNAADEGGLFIRPEALAAAGSEEDAGGAGPAGGWACGVHTSTVAGRSE
jgi:hypothetical protein